VLTDIENNLFRLKRLISLAFDNHSAETESERLPRSVIQVLRTWFALYFSSHNLEFQQLVYVFKYMPVTFSYSHTHTPHAILSSSGHKICSI